MSALIATSLIVLSSLVAPAAALTSSNSRTHRTARLAAGAIAGIVVGCVVLSLLALICCVLCMRRRRRAVGPSAGNGGLGRPNGAGVPHHEAGYAAGPQGTTAPQGAWSQSAPPAHSQYAAPAGAPPAFNGGFNPALPQSAHAKPY